MTSEMYLQRRTVPDAGAVAGGVLMSTRPATDWPSGAFPIGNGRLGALLSGGVGQDRIQLIESVSAVDDADFDTLLAELEDAEDPGSPGSHRSLAGLLVTFDGVPTPGVRPGGEYQDSSPDECIAKSIDDHAGTKWCIIAPPSEVHWIATLPEAMVLRGYSLTSANDAPERDPRRWRFEGSNDSETWDRLDEVDLGQPFQQRFMAKTFRIANDAAYLHYRFVFLTDPGVSHFQVAEVTLPGVDFGVGAPEDYRRVLDPDSGVHSVEYSATNGLHKREAFASREADLIVLKYATDDPEGMHGTIDLVCGRGIALGQAARSVARDGSRITLEGPVSGELAWAAQAGVSAVGGSLAQGEGVVDFHGCTALEIRLDLRSVQTTGTEGCPGPVAQATLEAAVELRVV